MHGGIQVNVTLFDSDGNPIDGPFDLTNEDDVAGIGLAIARHYRLVDSVPGADEPFLTIVRNTGDNS
jgi:hypothetical protein